MKSKTKISKAVLGMMSLLYLDTKSGVFTWKSREGNSAFNKRFAGKRAGHMPKVSSGPSYERITVNGKSYLSHRLVRGFVDGRMPRSDMYVDHISGDTMDNRPCNTRNATPSQNSCNRSASRNSVASKFKGVNKCKQTGLWLARITKSGKVKIIGRFGSEYEAARNVDAYAVKLHKNFARLNFPSPVAR